MFLLLPGHRATVLHVLGLWHSAGVGGCKGLSTQLESQGLGTRNTV